MRYSFAKYEGLGNDFLVVEQARFPRVTSELARKLCDRHFGVGGDGVLITGVSEGRAFMRVVNADGSTPEMCGNGLRCVALYLADRGLVRDVAFEVATDAGPHHVRVSRDPDMSHGAALHRAIVEVQMRAASLAARDVLRDAGSEHVIDQPFEVEGRSLHVTAVSMGNPHVVLFDELASPAADMQHLGPRIEQDARFRAGANVGFARLRDAENVDLTVWERGVGFTLACGTGACAAAVAAVETGRARRGVPLTVHLPGGPLRIVVGESGTPISMTGPARRVFEGELELDLPLAQ
ncbi:MAG: Diaminopimelate epimerase [Myxococcaceae bacterium]|nr:Diaminopimelate epimerase [Myxococcaceae bacterium]